MTRACERGVAGARLRSSVPGSGTQGTTRARSRPHEGAQRLGPASPGVFDAPVAVAGLAGADMGQVSALPQLWAACMGHEALPQQDFAAAGARAFRGAALLPSTAAQTGDSIKIPGASDARTRRARPKARIERSEERRVG